MPSLEGLQRHGQALLLQARLAARHDPGGPVRAQDLALGRAAGGHEAEDVLEQVDLAFHAHDLGDQLHMERFTIAATDKGGEGGTVHFGISDKSAEIDGATTILQAGEDAGIQMPFGCRMGICQTCVLPLEEGHVRDIRSGQEHGAGDRIQTCVSTASGDCTIKI